ncbi:hypothetical protein DPEC_G00042140 [Dallia pectoralis]|uniref:Uncharacterized protein n=1 Tax=Dallia pectoralis TaxID=75939 RepID=A0ACC2H932_DALPE|nr:hypothetical protein DPEC_G00042140 [Dallia pectoralis]
MTDQVEMENIGDGKSPDLPTEIKDWSKHHVRNWALNMEGVEDVLPHKRFLVVFLLLSTVSEKMDPLLETFSIFLQELGGTEQILCICENEEAFTSWKDLIETRYGLDIKKRSIYELSFAEVNGTILSLWSDNRKSIRFLPCGGGIKVMLKKKVETSLDTLNVLCVNQCEGGNEDKSLIEETFYKGGKVTWWNFYFSEQPGSMPFIKRDKFDFIVNTILPLLSSLRKACVLFNLFHLTGCGGTTLGMHVLWTLKDQYRCAVLKDRTADRGIIAEQVVNLLTYETTEQSARIPVLLMLDNFEEMEDTYDLQQLIEKECVRRKIGCMSPQVILLNCMMTECWEKDESTEDTVFIGNNLSEMEQKQFETKLEEIEKTYKNADTFYAFMIMKKNFSPEYIQSVARNTLRGFNISHKQAQLIAVLALLNVYCNGAVLSVSLCEEFLGLQAQQHCGSYDVKAGFGKFSTLVTCCTEEGSVVFEAVRMIHSSMAGYCLQELTSTYSATKAAITDLLLTTEIFYECIQGKDKLRKDVHTMLVKRQHSGEDSQFSPLINDISNETPGVEENVLFNAAKRFEKDAIISQLLSRYQYLKKRNFREAKYWAKNAKELSRDNSYISDTSAQVMKHELKNEIQRDKEELIKPDKLKDYLRMAQSATEAFRETQDIAIKEAALRMQNTRDNSPYNTAGCLGEIQVAVIIIEILEKIPLFSSGNVQHDILSEVLSGKIEIQNVAKNDPKRNKHASYYPVLQEFEELLYNLRLNMKKHFDFLDNFHVNLGHRFTMKDNREERSRLELFRCFQRYRDLFCKMDSSELMRNKKLCTMLRIHKVESQKVASYVSQMRTLYWNQMKSVFNGKSPVVHFFLGNKPGYGHLVHRGEIERCSPFQRNYDVGNNELLGGGAEQPFWVWTNQKKSASNYI